MGECELKSLLSLTCRGGLQAGPWGLSPPAEPECRGLSCAARVLNAIHYPGDGAVLISPKGRAQGPKQSRRRENGAAEPGNREEQWSKQDGVVSCG